MKNAIITGVTMAVTLIVLSFSIAAYSVYSVPVPAEPCYSHWMLPVPDFNPHMVGQWWQPPMHFKYEQDYQSFRQRLLEDKRVCR